MNYAAYSTEDFLTDESFQAFVLENDPVARQFWQHWLIQHPHKEAAFEEAVAVLQLLQVGVQPPLPTGLQQAEADKFWQSIQPLARAPTARPALRPKRARRWVLAVVATVALLLAGLGLWLRPASTARWTQYATQAGETRLVRLPDSSRVVLRENSTLKLASWQPGHAREVWLTGEAYFSVAHTAPAHLKAVASAPVGVKFVVHTGALDVAVLGTQFMVLRPAGKTKVVLTAGQIQLTRRQAGQAGQQLLLQPGEVVEYNDNAPQAPLAKRPVRAAASSIWTDGHLDFDNTPMPEVVALLEDTYGLRITLRNPALEQQKLTGSVPSTDPDVLLHSIGRSLDAKVSRQGKQVWLD